MYRSKAIASTAKTLTLLWLFSWLWDAAGSSPKDWWSVPFFSTMAVVFLWSFIATIVRCIHWVVPDARDHP